MKALYTPAPAIYGLAERPQPVTKADQALVKVARAAICHTDVIIRNGVAGHVRYPVIPGHEFSGVVEACGSVVQNVKPGDRVAIHTILSCGRCTPCRKGDSNGCENLDEMGSKSDGGFAEYCVVPARHLYKIPDHLSLAEAAMTEPLANAASAVRQANIRLGDRVVIIGPGPIGLLALQVAHLANPSILVLVGTRDERLAVGQRLGATHVVNIRNPGALETLKDILGGKGADVAIECAGTRSALELAMEIIGWRGRIAVEGVFDTQEMVPISPYWLLLSRAASLLGICGWVTADFVQALELLCSGLVESKPLITHTFALDEWEMAFAMVTERKSEAIKVQFAF